ncbi:MAG: aminoacyl--tRNA ligase-related protein [bacterium]|nr:aminoacyl--tRNA ligase-related protein [bacterium]
MKYSQSFINTRRDDPKDETATNARLLLRGGFIDKLMAGSFTFLPLGWRVYQKIEQIVREEMNAIGSAEILMPLLHPKDVWNETGRWADPNVKQIMYQFKSVDEKEYGLSFTHEEIFLDVIRKNSLSYKNLPIKLYHFSTKFRNEARAKSGLLRGREFIMKDLYSMHTTQEDLDKFYWEVKDAYLRAFNRVGLKDVKVVEASGGVFTSGHTHEFQLVSPVGEDNIYFCNKCDWAQNKEIYTHKIGDPCPKCGGQVEEASSIEVGNIFRFGTVYSEKMGINFKDSDGKDKPPYLGSYGIGMSRLIGVLAEVFNDDVGIKWPKSVAPFLIHLVSLGNTKTEAEKLYRTLAEKSVDVLWDDREESAGVKLSDADLIGIPYRIIVSDKTLAQESVEIKERGSDKVEMVKLGELSSWLEKLE